MSNTDWLDDHDMPSPPLNDKGRPRWPHAHQAKLAYIDTEFLTFQVDHHYLTDVAIWLEEENTPQRWKIHPNREIMRRDMQDERKAASLRKAAKVNGFHPTKWKGAPEWADVREEIARAVFGRVLVGNNVASADVSRLASGFWPRDTQWLMPYGVLELQSLARLAGHKKTNLDALCAHYGLPEEGIHNAVGGVRRVRAVAAAITGDKRADRFILDDETDRD